MNKVKLNINRNGDTRTATRVLNKSELYDSSVRHISDVYRVMKEISSLIIENGRRHDYTKLDYIDEFYNDYIDSMINESDFTKGNWHRKHITEEAHHPYKYCRDDITFIDLIEMCADIICASKTRSGKANYGIRLDNKIFHTAYKNTLKLIDNLTELE